MELTCLDQITQSELLFVNVTKVLCSFKVDGHDPAVCQKACCQDPKCLAWTFADPQPLLLVRGYTTINIVVHVII